MINVGDEVKDKITGLRGIAVARCVWLNGCIRISLQPRNLKNGKPLDLETIDEAQLVLVKRNVIKGIISPPAGPRDDKAALRRN